MTVETENKTETEDAPKWELQRVTRQELLVRAEETPPAQFRSFSELQMMAGHIARTGIMGTKNADEMLCLMLMSQAEGRDAMAVKGRWWIWSDNKGVHTQRKSQSILADFHRAGGQTQILVDTAECVTIRFLYRGRDYTCTWDEATVKTAGLHTRDIHKNYPRRMKFHRCVTEGVAKIAPEVLDGAVAVGETIIDIEETQPMPAISGPAAVAQATQPAEVEKLASKGEVAKALSRHKKLWAADGKPSLEDLAPAWAWLSVVLGSEIADHTSVPASAVAKVEEIFALGKTEVQQRLADEAQRQSEMADAVDAEFEEDAQVGEDDPFGGVE